MEKTRKNLRNNNDFVTPILIQPAVITIRGEVAITLHLYCLFLTAIKNVFGEAGLIDVPTRQN